MRVNIGCRASETVPIGGGLSQNEGLGWLCPGRNKGGGLLGGGGCREQGGDVLWGGCKEQQGGVLLGKGGGCKEQKGGVLWGGL